MQVDTLLAAYQEGKVLGIDVKGIELIGFPPDDVRAVKVFECTDGKLTPVDSGEMRQKDISDVLGAISKLGDCWSSFDYDTVEGLPIVPTMRYFAGKQLDETWLKQPRPQ